LGSGLVQSAGLREVVFAGYSEGHPRIALRTLDEAPPGPRSVAGDPIRL
jgi:hypothetical protein